MDQDSVVSHMFCPFVARCVRVNPMEWNDKIAMRFDLLGCPANTRENFNPVFENCYKVMSVLKKAFLRFCLN